MHAIQLGDLHTHTELDPVERTVQAAADQRLDYFGISDHLNFEDQPLEQVLENLDVFRRTRQHLLDGPLPLPVYFGVEVHMADHQGRHPLDEGIMEEFRFDYTIGGLHGVYGSESLSELAASYHRLHMKILEDPRLNVLGHPFKISRGMFEKGRLCPFEDLRYISDSQVDELISAARENDKAVEVASFVFHSSPKQSDSFRQAYRNELLPRLIEGGVKLVMGSDAHGVEGVGRTRPCRDFLAESGVRPDQIWTPPTCLGRTA